MPVTAFAWTARRRWFDLTTTNVGSLCDQDFVEAHLSALVDKSKMPICIMCDKKAAIAISKNPVLHKRSKHINIHFHVVRLECVKGHAVMVYIPTKENIADMMTKALTKVPQQHLSGKVMAGMKDGKMVSVEDEPLEGVPHAALREKLYTTTHLDSTPREGTSRTYLPRPCRTVWTSAH